MKADNEAEVEHEFIEDFASRFLFLDSMTGEEMTAENEQKFQTEIASAINPIIEKYGLKLRAVMTLPTLKQFMAFLIKFEEDLKNQL